MKSSLKETHSFAPSFNPSRANVRRAKPKTRGWGPDIFYLFFQNILQKSKFSVGQRVIEFALEKKDGEGPYWTRLVKDAKKQHWLKIDFNKWRDEDESDEEAGGGEGLEQVGLF